MAEQADIVIIGAGAAGLMAGIWAGQSSKSSHAGRRIVILDGAKKPGAKILVAGGGRCNVTHDQVDAADYAGSSPNAIKKVLRRFDVPQTIAFFRDLGVELKREDTGKLFPTTDSARTVLNALWTAVNRAGVTLQYPRRVDSVVKCSDQDHAQAPFCVRGAWGQIEAGAVILASGGMSLPRSGSDGHGYAIARALGHHLTPRIFPGLVPLTLPRDHFIGGLSGITVPATLDLHAESGKRLVSFTDSTLCTHFGLSGPSVLNISRYYLDAHQDDPGVTLTINWLPGTTAEQVEQDLRSSGRTTPLKYLNRVLPERLARALCAEAGVEPGTPGDQLTRPQRKTLARIATALPLPIIGSRGFNEAEVTAGGVPLSELHLDTMESRLCSGLFLCGEICDVDGRIGGFNFQWAWASGYVAGLSAGK